MIWPPSPYLISLVIFVILLVMVLFAKGASALDPSRLLEVALTIAPAAFVIGNLFIPAIWVSGSFAIKGGTFEQNLYPGATVGNFIFWTFAVSIVATAAAVYRFLGYLRAPINTN